MKSLTSAVLAAAFFSASLADVYLHFPRGSNDRCDEKSNDRNNDERCFDSENNAAGGYAICDKEMFFYEKTVLPIEWYSQHGCGNGATNKNDPNNPENVHCNIVIQLGCEPDFAQYAAAGETYKLTDGISLGRPGADRPEELQANPDAIYDTFGDTCTQKRPTSETCAKQATNDATCDTLNLANERGTFNSDTCRCSRRKMQTYCYYEPEAYWLKCQARERNKGLFTATQNPNNNGGATRTRQEPNSDRYGFECVEERDYWPYWHPSPWRDLVVFTSDTGLCPFYQSNSQNVMDKCECVAPEGASAEDQAKAMFNNQQVPCTVAGFTWKCWGSFKWRKPDCVLSSAQSDNALGRINSQGDNVDKADGSRMAHYDWLIDDDLIPSGQEQVRCLIRLRYNISTADIDGEYDVSDNNKISQNPVYTVGEGNATLPADQAMPLRMAINTAQYGRTFQDRTYVFAIRKRPAELRSKTIHNLSVRGKRGNIAQVRNCVEYDFMPIQLSVNPGDYVHFQWCGSEYNPNGNAGEGRAGTDRTNIIATNAFDTNIVTPFNATEKFPQLFSKEDLQTLAWLGQKPENCYTTTQMLGEKKNSGNDPKSCHFLNGVKDADGKPTSYFSHIAKVAGAGVFKFMSSRNNNFTNRSQKGQIISGGASAQTGVIVGAVVGSVAGVALVGGLGFLAFKKGVVPGVGGGKV